MKPSFLSDIRKAKKGDEVWDKGERESVSGLHVRALSDDHKVFMFYYRPKDRAVVTVLPDGTKKRKYPQRRLAIGDFGPMSVGAARKQASEWAARVRLGEDPKADRDGTRDQLTVRQVYERCIDDAKQGWNTTAYQNSGWRYDCTLTWKTHLEKEFGDLKLSEVKIGRVRTWHAGYKEKGRSVGNKALANLSRLFTYAQELELFEGMNPCKGVEKHNENKRHRYANEQELRRLGEVLQGYAESHPAGVAFLYTLAYTGARPKSIEDATWDQLQVDLRPVPGWHPPLALELREFGLVEFYGKSSRTTGANERVVIPPRAMALLRKLPRTTDTRLFGMKLPRRLWEKVRAEAGCPDLWARDWRRTWTSVGRSKAKISMDQLKDPLNHWTAQTTALYGKMFPDDLINTVAKVHDTMEAYLPTPA